MIASVGLFATDLTYHGTQAWVMSHVSRLNEYISSQYNMAVTMPLDSILIDLGTTAMQLKMLCGGGVTVGASPNFAVHSCRSPCIENGDRPGDVGKPSLRVISTLNVNRQSATPQAYILFFLRQVIRLQSGDSDHGESADDLRQRQMAKIVG